MLLKWTLYETAHLRVLDLLCYSAGIWHYDLNNFWNWHFGVLTPIKVLEAKSWIYLLMDVYNDGFHSNEDSMRNGNENLKETTKGESEIGIM